MITDQDTYSSADGMHLFKLLVESTITVDKYILRLNLLTQSTSLIRTE